jgi:hypothetical protein
LAESLEIRTFLQVQETSSEDGYCRRTRATAVKIESIRIKNFQSFRDELVHLGDYTSLVGPNGAVK